MLWCVIYGPPCISNVIFPQICQIFQSYGYHIVKHYLPLFQQIADSQKKFSLMGTLVVPNSALSLGEVLVVVCSSLCSYMQHPTCKISLGGMALAIVTRHIWNAAEILPHIQKKFQVFLFWNGHCPQIQ